MNLSNMIIILLSMKAEGRGEGYVGECAILRLTCVECSVEFIRFSVFQLFFVCMVWPENPPSTAHFFVLRASFHCHSLF